MHKQKNKQTGITLIALVVTIIVLIILAGVSISMVVGDNGIITQAQRAKEETANATEKEKIELAVVASQLRSEDNMRINKDDLEYELQQQLDEEFELTDNKDGSFLIAINSEKIYYISESGKVVEESHILQVASVEELEKLREEVNAGDSFDDQVVLLMDDITLSEDWNPIGYVDEETIISFNGEFNGLNNKINNININNPEKSYQGLFASIGTSAKISSIVVTGNITGAKYVGGIAGYNEGSIKNCGNEANVVSQYEEESNPCVGGIVGYNVKGNIKGCYNKGQINAVGYSNGGIVGKSDSGTIKNCYNNAAIIKEVTTSGGETAGICGTASETNIYNVYNSGNVTANGSGSGTGGIIGLARNNSMISNAYNIAQIQASDNTGGIIGCMEANGIIENSYNKTEVSGRANVSGIVGGIRLPENIKISRCYHYGSVEAEYNNMIGTIGGRTEYEIYMQNCEWYTDNQEYYNKVQGKTSIPFNENIDMKNVLEVINGENFFVSNNDNNNPKLYWE